MRSAAIHHGCAAVCAAIPPPIAPPLIVNVIAPHHHCCHCPWRHHHRHYRCCQTRRDHHHCCHHSTGRRHHHHRHRQGRRPSPIIVKVVARHATNCHAFAIVVVVLTQCTAKIAGQTLLSDPCEIPLSDPSSVGSIAIGVAASTLHWKCRHWRWWWGAAHPSLGSGVNELTMTSSGRVQQAEPAMMMMGPYAPSSAVAAGGAPSLLGEWGCHAVGI